MTYEVINRELGISSCKLSDLTLNQVQHFLELWGDGSQIGTLTLFFDDESGDIVLNRDNKDFDFYKDIAEEYLNKSERGRQQFRDSAPKGLEETLLVLENAIVLRRINQEIFKAKRNCIDDSERPVINMIGRDSNDSFHASCLAFCYGVMCGKRTERARRKKTA